MNAKASTKKASSGHKAKAGESPNRRNPERTREEILEVASKLIARDGPQGLSVSQVAQIAGVNRGTAYHHFRTREELIDSAMRFISERLHLEVYGEQNADQRRAAPDRPRDAISKLVLFAIENPEFGPAWMHQMVRDPKARAADPFWQRFMSSLVMFADTDLAQPGIDPEAHAVTLVTSIFAWPLWTNAADKSARQRKELALRFINETLRLAEHGVLRSENFK
jgi:AcrR family transcriptional regulator